MNIQTWFERMQADDEPIRSSHVLPKINTKELYISLTQNILNVLNTREEMVPIRSDMGLPDYRHAGQLTEDHLAEIARLIRYQVEQFEPRLTQVAVDCSMTDDSLHQLFQIDISALLKNNQSNDEFTLHLIYKADGRIVTQ